MPRQEGNQMHTILAKKPAGGGRAPARQAVAKETEN
jgi:hypothetical protein